MTTVMLTITTTQGEVIECCEVSITARQERDGKLTSSALLSNEIVHLLEHKFEVIAVDPVTKLPLPE